jgi:hypothetical protein
MMKSVNRGNAEAGAILADTGVMPVMARDTAGGGQDPGRGGDALDGQQPARVPWRQLIDDRLDARPEQSLDEARALTGEGSILGGLVKAVLEQVLETSETEYQPIAQPEGNRRTGRFMPGQGFDACVNGGADAHPTCGR